MSLILEALKKSEAERRLGQAPNLLSPVMTARSERPSRRPLFAVAAIMVLAGVILWWQFTQWATDDTAPITTASQQLPGTPAAITESAPPHKPELAPTKHAQPMPTPARSPADTIANVPVPQDPQFHGTERESVTMPATAIPLPESMQDAPTRPTSSSRPAPTPITPATPSTPQPDTQIPTKTPASPAEPELEALPRLAYMLPAEREGLPPLRLSMHVYDPEPAARFVLIDGKRYRQGDAIAKDVVVDAIRVDGVAISWRGQRFLLPRP